MLFSIILYGNSSLKTNGTLAMDIDAEIILAELTDTYRQCIIDIKPGFINFNFLTELPFQWKR